MRGKWALALLPVAVIVGCGSSASSSAADDPTVVSTDSAVPDSPSVTVQAACTPSGDLLVWELAPGLPAAATEIGIYPAGCPTAGADDTLTYMEKTSPGGAGYCTKWAYATDNPGYDIDVKPAAPLRNIVGQVGDAC